MDEIPFAYVTAGVIVAYFLAQVLTRRFDPFAPTWLYLVGYVQIYVIQAIHYHDWGVSVRGKDVVAAADWMALWSLLWFLLAYHLGPGRALARVLPRPPRAWSSTWVSSLSPFLVLWGLFCAGVVLRSAGETPLSGEASLITNFPFVMLVAAVLLIVTGRNARAPRPGYLAAGLAVSSAYTIIWMFNGKRSHSLIGVLATICALYLTRLKRPSWAVLLTTAVAGALVVAVAIGWRTDSEHPRSFAGFVSFLSDFQVSRVLQSLNVTDLDNEIPTYETEEYGGFLLMMDTVPGKSGYDYGANYLRVFSTFIPRALWPSKPLFGRPAWIEAWIAGSELEREEDFSGPSIGLLGATQLNGGSTATAIVLACIALVFRAAYEYLRLHADVPWVQFWWAITYYNAWFVVVCDNPLAWFYLNWGFTTLPLVVLMWWANRSRAPAGARDLPGVHGPIVGMA